MPLGLPSHLAARTTTRAVARAGHAIAAVSLVSVGIVGLSVEVSLPEVALWPALLALLPMLALLVMLDLTPSRFIAGCYVVIGGLGVYLSTLIVSTELGAPIAYDDYVVQLLKLALMMVVGVTPKARDAIAWTTLGYVAGELATFAARATVGAGWQFDGTPLAIYLAIVGTLAVVGAERFTTRASQSALFRAARDEQLAEVRAVFESRATALLHDTVLNQLAVVTATPDARLSREVRESIAADLLRKIGHEGGPLSQRLAAELASHLGFTLHYVSDLPSSTRSITDLENGRIYLPVSNAPGRDPRANLLQALAGHVLGRPEPRDYDEFLTQRVESNYLAAAMMIPEGDAVAFLQRANERRELAVEDLRDAFAVTYETAAHRFTNLATEHLGIPVHFLKVSPAGVLSKAYENDSVQFPKDALGAVEGQLVCRKWSARHVFDEPDRFSAYHQYTDKPTGTYWCTSRIESGSAGEFSISVGTPFAHVKWFRGRETTRRGESSCPDPACCRQAPAPLAERWSGAARPQARIHSSLLAALPTESFPGVDQTEVYGFLERHAPRP